MDISISTALLLTISCCLWATEGREYKDVITVTNGGPWGYWGKAEFCPEGYAVGFSLKVQELSPLPHPLYNSALNAIRLKCSDGTVIESSVGPFGPWKASQTCPSGYLVSFSLRVQEDQGEDDDTAANNIQFSCSDGSELMGSGTEWGEFGEWSPPCPASSFICGIQTKLDMVAGWRIDTTSLNDVKFFCCE